MSFWSDFRIFPSTPSELLIPTVNNVQCFMDFDLDITTCLVTDYITRVTPYQFMIPAGVNLTVRLTQDFSTGSSVKTKVYKIAFKYGDVEVTFELRRIQQIKFVKDANNFILMYAIDRVYNYLDATKNILFNIDYWSTGVLYPLKIVVKPKIVISGVMAWELIDSTHPQRLIELSQYRDHRSAPTNDPLNDHYSAYPFNLSNNYSFI